MEIIDKEYLPRPIVFLAVLNRPAWSELPTTAEMRLFLVLCLGNIGKHETNESFTKY